jgi:hypothetical protein
MVSTRLLGVVGKKEHTIISQKSNDGVITKSKQIQGISQEE